MYVSIYDWIGDEIPDFSIINDLLFHPINFVNSKLSTEYDYVARIYSQVINPYYKRKHDAKVIGNDTSGNMPPRIIPYSYSADVIEFLLEKMPKFNPKEIGYYNTYGMP